MSRLLLQVALLIALSLNTSVTKAGASNGSSVGRTTQVTNGEMVSAGQYPFLTALVSGRSATVQINGRSWPADYLGGSLQLEFEGPLVDCGPGVSVCADAVGKVCAITFDRSSAAVTETPTETPIEQQISNCRAGGGVGVIFRHSGGEFQPADLAGYPEIPAVYLSSQFAYEYLMRALNSGELTAVGVQGELSDTILCGATYLGDSWVLTAAHCVVSANADGNYRVRNAEEIRVNVGAHDLSAERQSSQTVAEVIIGNYRLSGPWSENDFALLRLHSSPRKGLPISLIDRSRLDELMASAAPALILGWGSQVPREVLAESKTYTTTNTPRAALLTLHTVADCRHHWYAFFRDNNLSTAGLDIRDIHVCASNPELQQDACQGDSGGPLLVEVDGELKLAGITSFGLGCGAVDGVPGVYASVPALSDWVAAQTGLFTGNPSVQVQFENSFVSASSTGAVDITLLLMALLYLLYSVLFIRFR